MTTEQTKRAQHEPPRELPPLPEMGATFLDDWGPEVKVGFTADQMRDYALEAIAADRALVASQAQPAAEPVASALERFKATDDECVPSDYGTTPFEQAVERLRFFCSIAMQGQDWIDVEVFFDALLAAVQQPAEPRQDSVHSVESGGTTLPLGSDASRGGK